MCAEADKLGDHACPLEVVGIVEPGEHFVHSITAGVMSLVAVEMGPAEETVGFFLGDDELVRTLLALFACLVMPEGAMDVSLMPREGGLEVEFRLSGMFKLSVGFISAHISEGLLGTTFQCFHDISVVSDILVQFGLVGSILVIRAILLLLLENGRDLLFSRVFRANLGRMGRLHLS